MLKLLVPILMALESLAKQNKQRVKESNVVSIVFRHKIDSIIANYIIIYRGAENDFQYSSCEIFIAKYLPDETYFAIQFSNSFLK